MTTSLFLLVMASSSAPGQLRLATPLHCQLAVSIPLRSALRASNPSSSGTGRRPAGEEDGVVSAVQAHRGVQLGGAVGADGGGGPGRHAAHLPERVPLLPPGGAGGRQRPPRRAPPPLRAFRLRHLHLLLRVAGHQHARLHLRRGAQGAQHRDGGALRAPQVLRRGRAPGELEGLQLLRQAVRHHGQPEGHGRALRHGVPRRRQGRQHRARGRQERQGHGVHGQARGTRRRPQEAGRRQGARRRRARRRHGGQGDRLRLHVHLQGGLPGDVEEVQPGGQEPAAEPADPARRPPRAAPDAARRARHLPVDAVRLRAGAHARLHQPPPPRAHRLLHLQDHGHQAHRQGQPTAATQEGPPGGPLRLQPPHRARPRRGRRRAPPQGQLRHLQHLQVLRAHLAHQGRRAVAGARQGRREHPPPPGGGRPRHLPRGNHLPRALPAALQRPLRRAHRPHRARRHQHQGEHVPRLHRARFQDHGPLLLLHEPAADLRGHLPQPAAQGAHLQRWQVAHRGRQLHPEDAQRPARLRVHHHHPQGEVRHTRRHRRPCSVQEQGEGEELAIKSIEAAQQTITTPDSGSRLITNTAVICSD